MGAVLPFIPAIAGIGTSIAGGVTGKGAAKRQRQLEEEQRRQIAPLIQAQIEGTQYSLGKARELFDPSAQLFKDIYGTAGGAYGTAMTDYQKLLSDALSKSGELYGEGQRLSETGEEMLAGSMPYLSGAGTALQDLQNFYKPFMDSGARAIDRFLPSAQRTQELLAPEFGNINEGYRAASENIAKFAPRGGGRVSTMARADIGRQKGLSDLFFQGRQNLSNQALGAAFQGASGQQNVANALQSLGLGQGQLGLGTIGAGAQKTGLGTQYLGTGGGLAQNAFGQGLQALGQQLGAGQGLAGMAGMALSSGLGGGQNAVNLYSQQAQRAYDAPTKPGMDAKALGGFLTDIFKKKDDK